ncbi:unnamed protein product [Ascophyllum nodosum]
MRFNCLPSSGLVATPSALRDPLLSKRASTAGGGVLSRKPAAISTGDPPLWMSATRVEIDEDKVPGGGDASTAIVADDFDVKKDLMDQINLASSSKKRTEVNELMLKLEPMNPTASPAKSPFLNGVWEFLYTGGMNPGTLAVQVLSRLAKNLSGVFDLKGVTLTIKRDQPRVEAAVKASIFGLETEVKVRTRLEVRSEMRLEEVYEEAEIAGFKLPIPARIQPRRNLFITYLDDDVVIARDDSGAPDLLIRKDKVFPFNTGTPSTSEDDASPGSG